MIISPTYCSVQVSVDLNLNIGSSIKISVFVSNQKSHIGTALLPSNHML